MVNKQMFVATALLKNRISQIQGNNQRQAIQARAFQTWCLGMLNGMNAHRRSTKVICMAACMSKLKWLCFVKNSPICCFVRKYLLYILLFQRALKWAFLISQFLITFSLLGSGYYLETFEYYIFFKSVNEHLLLFRNKTEIIVKREKLANAVRVVFQDAMACNWIVTM